MHKRLRVSIKSLRGILALTVVTGTLGALTTIAQMILLSEIVNAVFLSHWGLAQLLLPLALLLGAFILRASLLWRREVTAQRAAIRLKASLRERVFAHLLRLGPAWSSGERTGELVAVVNEGIERLDAYISRYLPQRVLSVVVPLLIIIVILPVDWFSALLLLVTGPIIPLLMYLVGSYTEKRIQAQWDTLSRMSAHFLDVMQGLTTLKLFGRSQAQQERIAHISNRYRDKTLQVLRYAFLSGAVLEFMTMTAIGVIATTLGVRLLNHGITFESAFLVLLLTPEFYRPLQELGVQRHAAMEGEASARRIFEILETPIPVEMPTAVEEPIPAGAITLDITDLSYTYPGKEGTCSGSCQPVAPSQHLHCACRAQRGGQEHGGQPAHALYGRHERDDSCERRAHHRARAGHVARIRRPRTSAALSLLWYNAREYPPCPSRGE